ncbi:MAG: hypothetical protein IE925_10050 [Rhodobacterales bacterium]|nr:hypothetical protein [Rhodobacterales bacterium]
MSDADPHFIARNWPWLSAGVTLLGTGAGWLIKAFLDSRGGWVDRLERRLDKLDAQVVERDQRIDHLITERQQMAEQLLRANLALAERGTPPASTLKALIDRDCGMMFAKRRLGPGIFEMVRVSPLYAKTYLGGSVYDYDGKRDAEIWPAEIAALFDENDERIYRDQVGESVREPVDSPHTGVRGVFHGRKYPVRLHDGEDYIIGVGEHIASPAEDPDPQGENE